MPLDKIEFPPHMVEARTLLNLLDIDRFYFKGGVLRDLYAQKRHTDIDVCTQRPKTELWDEITQAASHLELGRAFLSATISNLIAQASSQRLRLERLYVLQEGIQLRMKFNSQHELKEEEIDITLSKGACPPTAISAKADASINSAICSEDGQTWAHRFMQYDLDHQYYRTNPDANIYLQCVNILRSERLKQKFERLQYIPNWKSFPLYQGWRVAPQIVKDRLMARHLRDIKITPAPEYALEHR
ncbi:MAG: hypothetical protein KDJ75_01110 [Alphaproteobacteria bacterium]|nr:hypothetical protein [Alphaproteobacteria bacterium]